LRRDGISGDHGNNERVWAFHPPDASSQFLQSCPEKPRLSADSETARKSVVFPFGIRFPGRCFPSVWRLRQGVFTQMLQNNLCDNPPLMVSLACQMLAEDFRDPPVASGLMKKLIENEKKPSHSRNIPFELSKLLL
jgi:hypothetical protein